jgi:hypothetical protein
MEITLKTGEASRQVLAALIFAVLMGASSIFGWLLDRYIGDSMLAYTLGLESGSHTSSHMLHSCTIETALLRHALYC